MTNRHDLKGHTRRGQPSRVEAVATPRRGRARGSGRRQPLERIDQSIIASEPLSPRTHISTAVNISGRDSGPPGHRRSAPRARAAARPRVRRLDVSALTSYAPPRRSACVGSRRVRANWIRFSK
ncbi:hypothetical protein EVAR_99977_1 [Eumeta japonica]|uniref:Uncharacterized protein n=1 Tax=Eumeta variegata TaxID=151549 RepID=A0A4C1ZIT4_EUMVA|nr:hypothetical protein EVAR_99977_1 [Eumeta japonica]